MSRRPGLFAALGGWSTLERVHKRFYDKVYAHPWLGRFFVGHSKAAIAYRQTTFMAAKMGGPDRYMGKDLPMAHRAMYITDALFDLRARLLAEALAEEGVPAALAARWLRIDGAFRRQVVKASVADFYRNSFRWEKRRIIPRSAGFEP